MRDLAKQLAELPPTLEDDPQRKLIALCGEFTHVLSQYVDGDSTRPEYYVQMRPHFKKLKRNIEATKPVFLTDDTPAESNVSGSGSLSPLQPPSPPYFIDFVILMMRPLDFARP
jgi:hypothetical protein